LLRRLIGQWSETSPLTADQDDRLQDQPAAVVVVVGLVVGVGTEVVVTIPAKVVVVVAAAADAASVNIADTVASAGAEILTDAGRNAIVTRMSGVNLIEEGSVVIVGLV